MPKRDPLPQRLHSHIRIVCDMMLKRRQFDPAHWLWMAAGSPRDCQSSSARDALRSAAGLARECGFGDVADWIRHEVLPPEE